MTAIKIKIEQQTKRAAYSSSPVCFVDCFYDGATLLLLITETSLSVCLIAQQNILFFVLGMHLVFVVFPVGFHPRYFVTGEGASSVDSI